MFGVICETNSKQNLKKALMNVRNSNYNSTGRFVWQSLHVLVRASQPNQNMIIKIGMAAECFVVKNFQLGLRKGGRRRLAEEGEKSLQELTSGFATSAEPLAAAAAANGIQSSRGVICGASKAGGPSCWGAEVGRLARTGFDWKKKTMHHIDLKLYSSKSNRSYSNTSLIQTMII